MLKTDAHCVLRSSCALSGSSTPSGRYNSCKFSSRFSQAPNRMTPPPSPGSFENEQTVSRIDRDVSVESAFASSDTLSSSSFNRPNRSSAEYSSMRMSDILPLQKGRNFRLKFLRSLLPHIVFDQELHRQPRQRLGRARRRHHRNRRASRTRDLSESSRAQASAERNHRRSDCRLTDAGKESKAPVGDLRSWP